MNAPSYGRIRRLVGVAARYRGISPQQLVQPNPKRSHAHTRFAVAAVAHDLGYSLGQIARQIGLRDHTSVWYGVRRAKDLREADPDFAELCGILEAELRA